MEKDILEKNPYLLLGSRLKRLSDRFLTDATKIHHFCGFELFPSQCVMLAQIHDTGEISVVQLAQILRLSQPAITRNLNGMRDLGLIKSRNVKVDNRVKMISLTPYGVQLLGQLRDKIWGDVDIIVREILGISAPNFAEQITNIEKELDKQNFEDRFKSMHTQKSVEIIEYDKKYATEFYDINAQWIGENFVLEDVDKYVLSNPEDAILKDGGVILLAKYNGAIVGTGALMKMPDGAFEFTKMGVLQHLRGLKIGEKLLVAAIERAKEMKVPRLFLLTNKKQEAAIHLYEKLGFIHSQEIMDKYGHEYERCNVAMDYPKIGE